MDTTFKTPEGTFTYRVSALILDGTKILMAHNKPYDQYYTIGGRAHFGETSEQAVLREVFEETGVRAEIDRLVFVYESFFTMDGVPRQEFGMFWLIKPFDYGKIDFSAIKCDGEDEEILWIDLADREGCRDKTVFPLELADMVLNLSDGIKHIVNVEDSFNNFNKDKNNENHNA